jgi:serine-type D-Ala-D-Ala carboxypeptidase (penicillin-binding protein 5/6)
MKLTSILNRLVCLILLSLASVAAAVAQYSVPQPPELPVRGYILMDFHSGRVLADHNSDQRMEPASITKLMSAYLVYQRLSDGRLQPDEVVPVSRNAYDTVGSRMFIEMNVPVTVGELLRGVVIQSGNDATVALAEYIAGSEAGFAQLMNEEAARLGMRSTNFTNASGLPHPEHYTTAADIALLTRALIRDFPLFYRIYSERSFTYNNIEQHNRNKLLWRDESVDGVKTGHTSSAGYCLVSSAERGDMRLIAVVLGADRENERFDASQNLLNYGFSHYETHRLYEAGQALTRTRLWKGEIGELPLGFLENVYVTIPQGRYGDMHAALRVNARIEAPISRGEAFGSVLLDLDGDEVADIPLVALQDVSRAGLLGRFTDQVLLMFASMFN